MSQLFVCPLQLVQTVLQRAYRVDGRPLLLGDSHCISIAHLTFLHHVADAGCAGSMRSRQAMNHHILALAQRFVEEVVRRCEEGDHLLGCVERSIEHVFADAVPKVSEALVALEEVIALTSLSVDDVEDLELLKYIQVLRRADISDVKFGACFRVDPDDIRNIIGGKFLWLPLQGRVRQIEPFVKHLCLIVEVVTYWLKFFEV